MVIGNGLLAREFNDFMDNDSILIFASGVSNSLERNPAPFEREKKLVLDTISKYPKQLFVYFSTCSIYDEAVQDRPYIKHKTAIEELIKEHSSNYLICRLSNITGKGGNDNTIFNYLVNSVKNEHRLTLWKYATRNIMDVEDMANVVRKVLSKGIQNTTVNIGSLNSYRIEDMVQRIEAFLNKTAILQMEPKGIPVEIDLGDVKEIVASLEKDFSINYIDQLLEKYHS